MSDLAHITTLLQQQQAKLDQLTALVTRPAAPGPILTLAEAMAYTKHGSPAAFSRWARRWRVTSTTNGRYARGALDRALHRESTQRARPLRSLA